MNESGNSPILVYVRYILYKPHSQISWNFYNWKKMLGRIKGRISVGSYKIIGEGATFYEEWRMAKFCKIPPERSKFRKLRTKSAKFRVVAKYSIW